MTTEELAKIIGVSRVTLSKVINGVGGVAPKTEEKIREYIEKYNFEPNTAARSLVGKDEPVIGLFSAYTESNAGAGEEITSHFATELINLVVNEAQKRGYSTLVHLSAGGSQGNAKSSLGEGSQGNAKSSLGEGSLGNAQGDTQADFRGKRQTAELERILGKKLVKGAILVGYDTGNEGVRELIEKGYPLVLINQERTSFSGNMAVVNMGDRDAAFMAIERIVESGHKRILYVGCGRHRLPAIRRAEGVQAALEKYRDKIERLDVLDGDFNEEKAYLETLEYFKGRKAGERPTALFAANDIMAIGAMNALKELNLSIPGDVAVIGHDDIQISRYMSPALTTMSCDFRKIAAAGVKALTGIIENEEVERDIELKTSFVERDSFVGCH